MPSLIKKWNLLLPLVAVFLAACQTETMLSSLGNVKPADSAGQRTSAGQDSQSTGKPADSTGQATAGNLGKCGDVNEFLKTKPVSAKDLMQELRAIKTGFASGLTTQSLGSTLLGKAGAAASGKAAEKKASAAKTAAKAPAAKTAAKTAAKAPAAKTAAKAPAAPAPAADKGCDVTGVATMASALTGGWSSGPLGGMASSLTDVLLDALVSDLSYQAIDSFLGHMLANPKILSEITVDIPEIASASPALRKRVLSLGAYLAAVKGSNLMVTSAQGDFDAAKEGYLKVMALREQAAAALMEALVDVEALRAALAESRARGSRALLSEENLRYVEAMAGQGPEAFMKDFRVQHLAIAYLRNKKDRRNEIVEMESAEKEFRGHYGAYVRTVTGAGSMVGFSSLFLKKAKDIVDDQKVLGGAALIPMLGQSAREVGSLAINVKKVMDMTDEMSAGSFSVEKASGEVVKRGLSFTNAVKQLDDGALAKLKSDLIRDDGKGYVTQLALRSNRDVARLTDHLTGKAERKALAEAFEIADPELFTFQNLLAGKTSLGNRYKKVTTLFHSPLAEPANKAGAADEAALWQVQQKLRNGIGGDYSNGDARRLLFAGDLMQGFQASGYRIVIDSLGMDGLNDHIAYMTAQAGHATTRKESKGTR